MVRFIPLSRPGIFRYSRSGILDIPVRDTKCSADRSGSRPRRHGWFGRRSLGHYSPHPDVAMHSILTARWKDAHSGGMWLRPSPKAHQRLRSWRSLDHLLKCCPIVPARRSGDTMNGRSSEAVERRCLGSFLGAILQSSPLMPRCTYATASLRRSRSKGGRSFA